MSEPAQSQGDDFEHPGDQTQPTAEILNALNIIKSLERLHTISQSWRGAPLRLLHPGYS